MHVLVAAPRQIDDHHLVLAHRRREFRRMRHRMRTFQRWNDSLGLGEKLEGVKRFFAVGGFDNLVAAGSKDCRQERGQLVDPRRSE